VDNVNLCVCGNSSTFLAQRKKVIWNPYFLGIDNPNILFLGLNLTPSFKQKLVISTSGCDSTGLGLSTVTAWSAATGLLWFHGFNPQNWIVFFSWKDM